VTTQPPDSRKVFVVHGRNEQIKEAVFGFLGTVGLEPIDWREAVAMTRKGTPYVGEVLDVALRSAQAIVVVMTPDDEAKLRKPYQKDDDPEYEKAPTPQPRPNVLFEAGFAMGHAPDRTVLIQIGNVRPFSDIQGRHVVRLDNTREKREDIAQRLRSVGCPVDLKGDDWLTKGDFEIHETPDSTPVESSGSDGSAASAQNAQRELEQTEVDILNAMADMARKGQKHYVVDDIAPKLGQHVDRVQYFLDRLCESKHVHRYYTQNFGVVSTYYCIDNNGRAYLVNHKII